VVDSKGIESKEVEAKFVFYLQL